MENNKWEWSDKPQLTNEKGWVIVKGENVFRYETWNEAVTVNTMLGGHLMSENFYENHYKNENL